MSYSDDLDTEYGPVCEQLTTEFGFSFEVGSTGGGFYAIMATLPAEHVPTWKGSTKAKAGDLILVTSSEDAGLLLPDEAIRPLGFGVGIHDDGDQVVWYENNGEPQNDTAADEIHDLIAIALCIRTTAGRNY